MKVAYCTPIWNHHQGPVCTELAKLLGADNFKMLIYRPLDNKWSGARMKFGWNLLPPDQPWIVGPPSSVDSVVYDQQAAFARSADFLIYSPGAPFIDRELLSLRRQAGKIDIIMGERYFKKPRCLFDWLNPRALKRWFGLWRMLHPSNVHYLTMNHWCVEDLAFLHGCKGRIWRWGYLTAVSSNPPPKTQNGKVEIGWCGRMIYWKRVDYILKALACLPQRYNDRWHLTILGEGEKECEWRNLALSLGLDDDVTFKGPVSSKEATMFMRRLDIYVMPSDREEGWGAALLEAMNECCAVVANKSAGSTLEVVENGKSGFVFDDADIKALSMILAKLIDDGALRRKMGMAAWHRVQDWSPQEGARRLVKLLGAIQSGAIDAPCYKGLCERIG